MRCFFFFFFFGLCFKRNTTLQPAFAEVSWPRHVFFFVLLHMAEFF